MTLRLHIDGRRLLDAVASAAVYWFVVWGATSIFGEPGFVRGHLTEFLSWTASAYGCGAWSGWGSARRTA
jgi:hypothetical protein